jgi:hypothetical protein
LCSSSEQQERIVGLNNRYIVKDPPPTPAQRDHRAIDKTDVFYLDRRLLEAMETTRRRTGNQKLITAFEQCRKILAAAVAEPPA